MAKTKKLRQKKPRPWLLRVFDWKYWFHDLARFTGWLHILIWFRPNRFFISKLAKKEYRKQEPYLIISNHYNFSDATALLLLFWFRRVPMLIQDGVTKSKASIFLKWFQCIFVNRENIHYKTFKECFERLDRGHCLGIFPEGHLVHNNEFETFKDGASLIAFKTNVRIFPIFLVRRDAIKNRQHIVVGEPFNPREIIDVDKPSIDDIRLVTAEMERRMQQLRDYYLELEGEKHVQETNDK